MRPLLQLQDVDIHTPGGQVLIQGLSGVLSREKVGVVGRNGVGKSTLFRVLSGQTRPTKGQVTRWGTTRFVPQQLSGHCSPGEQRARALRGAWLDAPDLLLLDEPTEDLDHAGRAWLFRATAKWRGGLLAVSHDPEFLALFDAFLVVAESGCQLVQGGLGRLEGVLHEQAQTAQRRYERALKAKAAAELRADRVAQRRRRKKAVGRLHELDRCQSRARLGTRKSAAQVSQAKVAAQACSRRAAREAWAGAVRRALARTLPLEVVVPEPTSHAHAVLGVADAELHRSGRSVFRNVNLSLGRTRAAVVGAKGSGKTRLLRCLIGESRLDAGRQWCDTAAVGWVPSAGEERVEVDSLREGLLRTLESDRAAAVLVAHRFPLQLADRALHTLSPGERTRARLILALCKPGLEVLVLDEPTRSLDLVGRRAVIEVLRAWTGGLVVASHDEAFLASIGFDRLPADLRANTRIVFGE